jgi:predicted amidophosphoribosyltransferase
MSKSEGKDRTCKLCGKPLNYIEEYLCDECFDKKMKEDMEILAREAKEEREAQDEDYEQYDESWRFRDNRDRSVFRE